MIQPTKSNLNKTLKKMDWLTLMLGFLLIAACSSDNNNIDMPDDTTGDNPTDNMPDPDPDPDPDWHCRGFSNTASSWRISIYICWCSGTC